MLKNHLQLWLVKDKIFKFNLLICFCYFYYFKQKAGDLAHLSRPVRPPYFSVIFWIIRLITKFRLKHQSYTSATPENTK